MAIKELFSCNNFKWVDVTDPSANEMEELSRSYDLNTYTMRDCLEPEHLPKYELIKDTHFFILRYYVHTFDKKMASIQELTDKIALFHTDSFLVTIHRSEIQFLKVLSRHLNDTNRCATTSELLTKILWNALSSFNDPANRLAEQVEFYEAQVMLRKTSNDLMESLYYIKRQATLSHKVLMLMVEPIHHIYIKPGEETLLQDVKDEHLKMQTLYAGIMEEVNNLLNLFLSFTAQKTNDVMRVLTIFSVFFMPLSFIVGLYGMNFKYMPELNTRWGYPVSLLLMAVITLVIYIWFRRKRWV
jgi:magnesium transporter